MLKQGLVYLVATIVLVFFSPLLAYLVHGINGLYVYFYRLLIPLFNQYHLSFSIIKIILLVLIPVVITFIPAMIYRLVQKKDMPYFLPIVWMIWLVVILSNLLVGHGL